MDNEVRITVAGKIAPFSKKTMTWAAKDGRSGTLAYNSQLYAKWKDFARLEAATVMRHRPLLTGPVVVTYDIYFLIPSSFSAKRRRLALARIERPIVRPDFDNCAKAIADSCLTGVVIKDDAHIVSAQINKWYAEKPYVEITVRPWQFDQPTLFEAELQTH